MNISKNKLPHIIFIFITLASLIMEVVSLRILELMTIKDLLRKRVFLIY